ncbi:hypothetical protein E4U39_003735 [Claviceps sp. Clav50 group G5]|nr:hypothetical protein E4U39_003735 [Claviceps sp. Clav50 group G5]
MSHLTSATSARMSEKPINLVRVGSANEHIEKTRSTVKNQESMDHGAIAEQIGGEEETAPD